MSRTSAIAWLVAAGLLVGCKDPQMDHLRGIRDDVCACKSSACADQAMARVPQTRVESTRRTQRVAREMLDCLAKLHEDERPAEPDGKPDGEPASAEPTASGGGAAPAAARTPPR